MESSDSDSKQTTDNNISQTPEWFRKVYQTLGFQRGYPLILWFIFGGTLFGFSLARLEWLDVYGKLCPPEPRFDLSTALPSLCYSVVTFVRYRIAIILHLATVIPAALIAVLQFLPVIRHRFLLYHRLAGYTAVLLMTVGLAGACMLADSAMGGEIAIQAGTGAISVYIVFCFALAIYNIKRLQIDQHRAWMLRGWTAVSFVITQRLLQIIIPPIVTRWPLIMPARFAVISCDELAYLYQPSPGQYESQYPACLPENRAMFAADGLVPVEALFHPDSDRGMSTASINISFAATGQIAFVLHIVFAELYISLTRREAQRLRKVSYERQLRRGFKSPGSAGLVPEKLGDSDPWVMPGSETAQESGVRQA